MIEEEEGAAEEETEEVTLAVILVVTLGVVNTLGEVSTPEAGTPEADILEGEGDGAKELPSIQFRSKICLLARLFLAEGVGVATKVASSSMATRVATSNNKTITNRVTKIMVNLSRKVTNLITIRIITNKEAISNKEGTNKEEEGTNKGEEVTSKEEEGTTINKEEVGGEGVGEAGGEEEVVADNLVEFSKIVVSLDITQLVMFQLL